MTDSQLQFIIQNHYCKNYDFLCGIKITLILVLVVPSLQISSLDLKGHKLGLAQPSSQLVHFLLYQTSNLQPESFSYNLYFEQLKIECFIVIMREIGYLLSLCSLYSICGSCMQFFFSFFFIYKILHAYYDPLCLPPMHY